MSSWHPSHKLVGELMKFYFIFILNWNKLLFKPTAFSSLLNLLPWKQVTLYENWYRCAKLDTVWLPSSTVSLILVTQPLRKNTSLSNNQTKVETNSHANLPSTACHFTFLIPLKIWKQAKVTQTCINGLNSIQNKIMQFSTDLFKLCKVFVEFGNEMHQLSPFKTLSTIRHHMYYYKEYKTEGLKT